ncbi:unnamed protein product [Plutella xylostella]|uniref:(diamondback moth) hypothetical protein n=1 Tax=Plutella xylostella TaxID=51655 RepID=A0A8S4G754_PLUXY|nr:unnamed protein product [Plutella xylostella]
MRAIWVLLWKNAIIRKRRYIFTIMEPIVTLGFFILLFVFRKPLTAKLPPNMIEKLGVRQTEPVDLMSATPMPQTIFFYPDNVLTREVMELACYSLYMNVTNAAPGK